MCCVRACVRRRGRPGWEEEEEEGKGAGEGRAVVCAFCVWLLCLPAITPHNLAVKGWP